MFDIDANNKIVISPEMLLIQCFKDIHENYSQEEAFKYFSFIYFKHNHKSPYKKVYRGTELDSKIKEEVIGDSKWTPDKEVLDEAVEIYNSLQYVKSLQALDAAEETLGQITKYFNEFDLDTIPEEKKHTAINNVMRNLKELDDVVDKISSVRKRVEAEMLNKNAGRRKLGKREIPKSQR